jgi:ElaB/YqjD/DUF883 family membrane-anchored ribosome-binding protein
MPEHPTKEEHLQLENDLKQVYANLEDLRKTSSNKSDLATKDDLALVSDEVKILMQQHSDTAEQND